MTTYREALDQCVRALEFVLECGRGSSGRIIIDRHQETIIRETLAAAQAVKDTEPVSREWILEEAANLAEMHGGWVIASAIRNLKSA